jgi:hypothetical protein
MFSCRFVLFTFFQRINFLVSLLLILLLVGCAGLDSRRMAAQVDADQQFSTGHSIDKIAIRGEKEEVFGGPAYARKEQILDAARITLRNSGLFDSVDEGKGDLTLHIIVRAQNQKHTVMLEYTAIITITYRLTDPKGEVIWTQSYETEFSSHAFSGATRTVEAREGSVRENLAAMIDGIKSLELH